MNLQIIIQNIIPNYLDIIISLPSAIIIVGIIILYKFENEIKEFISNIATLRIGNVEAQRQKDTNLEIEPSVQKELSSEEWEFKYLNTTGFVPNTKLALLWFNSLSNNSSTKENFIKNFPLQEVDVNHDSEKEAIFSALLTSKLIETTDNGQTHKATDKGSRFLKFINYIS